jgi:hypothetical protein
VHTSVEELETLAGPAHVHRQLEDVVSGPQHSGELLIFYVFSARSLSPARQLCIHAHMRKRLRFTE